MSDHSDFMILFGDGHPYGGEGFRFSLGAVTHHMDKGGWICDNDECSAYWMCDSVEDALLMGSIFLVAPKAPNPDEFTALRDHVEEAFHVPLSQSRLDTEDTEHVDKSVIGKLREENGRVLAQSGIKLVVVCLASPSGLLERNLNARGVEFLKAVNRYGLRNVEYCETLYKVKSGSFDQEPKKGWKPIPEGAEWINAEGGDCP